MKKLLSKNNGITGIDLTVGLIVLTLFSGIIASLMLNTYSTSIEIQKSANAMAYATIILEKVDEKAYEDIDDNFVSTLKTSGEIQMSDDYTASLSTVELEQDLFKKVELKVNYNINGEQKTVTINKLKIKEIYKE